jgi:hypothetical protein
MGKRHGWGYYAARRYFVHTMMRRGREKKRARETARVRDQQKNGLRFSNLTTGQQLIFILVFWFIALFKPNIFSEIPKEDKTLVFLCTFVCVLFIVGFVAFMVHLHNQANQLY